MLSIKKFTFNPLAENTYVVFSDRDACCIIDPGCYFGNERTELQEFLKDEGLTPSYLLNTHCHLDHVFGNKFIAEKYKLELHIHLLEQPILDYAPTAGLKWDLPFDNYAGPLHFIGPEDKIVLGEDELRILFTPGHSPGSISFYNKTQGFVFAGDVLFKRGIGRTDFPGGDYNVLMSTINSVLFSLPDETIVYPGHGEETTIGYEKKNNPFLQANR